MRISSFTYNGYRNLVADTFSPHRGVNVICGDNAQGKTNLLEAIWLFTGNPSFRGGKWKELIRLDENKFSLSVTFETSKREQKATMLFSIEDTAEEKKDKKERKKRIRKITLNNVPLQAASEFHGIFTAVVFSPVHLSLIKDGPKNRREFLDEAISQIKPSYEGYKKQYDRLLEQRNALLRTLSGRTGANILLEVWNDQLAKTGVILTLYRFDYIKKLLPILKGFYHGLSGGREEIKIAYISTVFEPEEIPTAYNEEAVACYIKRLSEKLDDDVRQSSTTIGIHRDDIQIEIDGKDARIYGSQGQQRSGVIALKLSEATLLKRITGELPIMLLDDVMSELDGNRQSYILQQLKDMQVFITCCDDIHARTTEDSQMYRMTNGSISIYR